MEDKKGGRNYKAPYVATDLWNEFFKKMRTVNKPVQVGESELKQYGLAKGQEFALIGALKFLGLLDRDGKTTEAFKSIQVSGDQFKQNLGLILSRAYADLLEKHPLDHATYDGIKNYLAATYSTASATKMAKSFAALCQLAGWESPAFSRMRALPKRENKTREVIPEEKQSEEQRTRASKFSKNIKEQDTDELLREFIKTNPLPTTGQWNSETLKTYFEQYRKTLKMLKDKELQEE